MKKDGSASYNYRHYKLIELLGCKYLLPFMKKGKKKKKRSLRESHTPTKTAESQKAVSRPSSRVCLAELTKCLALAAPVSTPFSF